jgi:RNA polymerase-binding transcription factor DksA
VNIVQEEGQMNIADQKKELFRTRKKIMKLLKGIEEETLRIWPGYSLQSDELKSALGEDKFRKKEPDEQAAQIQAHRKEAKKIELTLQKVLVLLKEIKLD